MKKNVKAMYVAPVVELLEARVEKGFAGSGEFSPTDLEPVPAVGEGVTVGDANISNEFMGR